MECGRGDARAGRPCSNFQWTDYRVQITTVEHFAINVDNNTMF